MLLKKAKNQVAYFKCGLFGDTGSGKTYTAALFSIGLYKLIKSKKSVAFFDTEGGSSYILNKFQAEYIELLVARSRSLLDLNQFLKEAEEACDIAIIDSITHPWQEELKAYKRKTNRNFIQIQDWGRLKDTWREKYSDPFLSTQLHIIMCGRSANIFEDVEDDENGKDKKSFKAVKVGTKMRTEGETGYEPSLLIEMEKVYTQEGGKYVRRAHVVKDRFDVIDSQDFDNPTFENICPHVKLLNLGGKHKPVEQESDDTELFDMNGDTKYSRDHKRCKVALEIIETGLVYLFPSTGGEDKKKKLAVLDELTGSMSWQEISNMHVDELEGFAKAINRLKFIIQDGATFDDEKGLRKLVKQAVSETANKPEKVPA